MNRKERQYGNAKRQLAKARGFVAYNWDACTVLSGIGRAKVLINLAIDGDSRIENELLGAYELLIRRARHLAENVGQYYGREALQIGLDKLETAQVEV